MTSVANTLVVLAAEAGEHHESASNAPYIIGGVALVNGRWGRRALFSRVPPVEPV